MDRNQMLKRIEDQPDKVWDVIVIGGGATGLGTALDSTTRGYSTLLLEQSDFAKGTSSRSTKLVHGGVRYLAQGDISLVLEALHERGLLKKNAPHLFRDQSFIIPNYRWWTGPFYTVGMKVYDMMAGRLGLAPSEHISKEEVLEAIPNLSEDDLVGGVIYYDGQFDDARLAVNLAQSISENEGTIINYCKVEGLIKSPEHMITGVLARNIETGKRYKIRARAVINATGVFVDDLLKMDEPDSPPRVAPSQGIHIVLDASFLQGDSAIMIPKTSDGRVLFAVPWHGRVIVGTTDTPINDISLEPRALEEEIEFILNTASAYLERDPTRQDVLSVFAGLRPLAAPQDGSTETKEISRSHKLMVSLSGLVTITGGKWTTYRKMAQDTIDKAALIAGLEDRKCATRRMPIHGFAKNVDRDDHLHIYGSDKVHIKRLIVQRPELGEPIHPNLPFLKAEVVWAVRHEMARTVEDILARRTRALFLDARASIQMAEPVAYLMANELNWTDDHAVNEINNYKRLARGYLLTE